jgi:3',5'-cyclic AMP phosphodiesterase CpdA
MTRPFLLVQLSDLHIGADWAGGDPVTGLSAAISSVRRLRPTPDALLLTGDLVDHAAEPEYAEIVAMLDGVDVPHYVVPGNHDGRDALRRHFDIPGSPGTPVQYAADLGPLRLVMLDSTRVGADSGQLDAARLSWLDLTLAEDSHTPTVLAMHHPPLVTHVPAFDAMGLSDSDRAGLADVVRRHSQVSLILAGHVHRACYGELAGRPVLVAPSTYAELALDFGSDHIRAVAAPPGYVVHALRDRELVSHVEAVRGTY